MSENADDSGGLQFTGERFMPDVPGQIAYEHLHRYYLAMGLLRGMIVLDVACGEGYGSHILSSVAADVTGVDIAAEAVIHATEKYKARNLRFVEASAAQLPFETGSFDAVVSFETIEHLDLHEQMLSEIKRVLKPDGLLVISSPNKQFYSVEPDYHNPHHVKELFRDEFLELVSSKFTEIALFGQRVVHGSMIALEIGQPSSGFESVVLQESTCNIAMGLAKPLYDIIVAADQKLPDLKNSLFESTTHGMEAAAFYGIHLPERIANADGRIAQLELQLAERSQASKNARDSLEALRARVEQFAYGEKSSLILEQLDNSSVELASYQNALDEYREHAEALAKENIRLSGINETLEELVCEKDNELKIRTGQLASIQYGLDEYRQHAEALEQERARNTAVIAQAEIRMQASNVRMHDMQAQLERERKEAADQVEQARVANEQTVALLRHDLDGSHRESDRVRDLLEEALRGKQAVEATLAEHAIRIDDLVDELKLVHGSRSWRITAWLRWLSRATQKSA